MAEFASLVPPIKLHFGCGPRVLRGFTNVDLFFEPYANYMQYYGEEHYGEAVRGGQSDFIAFDVRSGPLPLADESVDFIFHEDFIEHLDQRHQILFLAETLRVLKTGGVHRVNTPDLGVSMRDHADFAKGYSGVFTYEWDHAAHLSVLTKGILEEYARMVGYSEVHFNDKGKSISPLTPKEYRMDPRGIRAADGNVYADLVK